jgi:hypothetical protein
MTFPLTDTEFAWAVAVTCLLLGIIVLVVGDRLSKRRDAKLQEAFAAAVEAERWWPFAAIDDETEDEPTVDAPTVREMSIEVPRVGTVSAHVECFDLWHDGGRPCGRCEQILSRAAVS